MKREELAQRHCSPVSVPTDRLTGAEIVSLMAGFPGWEMANGQVVRQFRFDDYRATMQFVNGVAWLAERENHHPEMVVGYNRCRVAYSTHDVGGLSMNDFICAAKIEALLAI